VTNPKLGADAVTGAKVANGSLTASDIAGMGAGTPLAGQIALDPPSIPADSCHEVVYAISGVQTGDYLIVNPATPLPGGFTIQPLTGTANNLHIQFCNTTGAPVDPASAVYSYLAIHP
jgi:hypothetical protein